MHLQHGRYVPHSCSVCSCCFLFLLCLVASASTNFCPYFVLLHLVLLYYCLCLPLLLRCLLHLNVCLFASLPLPTLCSVSLPLSVLTFLVTPSPWLTSSIAYSLSHSLCACRVLLYCYLCLPLRSVFCKRYRRRQIDRRKQTDSQAADRPITDRQT